MTAKTPNSTELMKFKSTYTGLQVLETCGQNMISSYRCSDEKFDKIVEFDSQGEILRVIPTNHPSKGVMGYKINDQTSVEYVIMDHMLYEITDLNTPLNDVLFPASVLDVKNGVICYFSMPNVIVKDLSSNAILFDEPCTPVFYGGHTPILVCALSDSADKLFLCHESGKLQLIDLISNSKLDIDVDISCPQKMVHCGQNDWILFHDLYPNNQVKIFDISTGEMIDLPSDLKPMFIGDFAYLGAKGLLATCHGKDVKIFNTKTFEEVARVDIKNTVKSSILHFHGESLFVRNDKGFVHRIDL